MLRNKTVLFADNNRTFLMLVGVLMKRLGLGYISATDGNEALRLIHEERPDLAVMDKDLNGISGLEALDRMRSERHNEPPIIIISDDHDPKVIEHCTSIGCFSYLTKPLVMRELHDAIQDALFTKHGTNRKNLRVDADLRVEVSYGDAVAKLNTETLSEGGVYLKLDKPIPVGEMVNIKFKINGYGQIKLDGRVIYNKRLAGDNLDIPPGSAVEFINVSEENAVILRKFVSKLIAGDIMAAENGEYLN